MDCRIPKRSHHEACMMEKCEVMEKYDLDKLRALPIEGVADRLGLKVKNHKALCPFHADSHPSLPFHVKWNTYKCFVCDVHGDPSTLVMESHRHSRSHPLEV